MLLLQEENAAESEKDGRYNDALDHNGRGITHRKLRAFSCVFNRRSFSTTFGTISIARSTSESELNRPTKLAAAICSQSLLHAWFTPGVLRLVVGVAEIQIAEINREREKTLQHAHRVVPVDREIGE